VETQTASGLVVQSAAYVYDVLGNLLSETVTAGGTKTVNNFAYTADCTLYADVGSSRTIQTRYVAGVGGPDTWLARVSSTGATTGAGGSAWLLSDYQGSVTTVVGLIGGVLDASTYNVFGSIVSETNPTERGELGFQGGRLDAGTGNWEFGLRLYDSERRDWTTQDPSGFGGGDSNWYRFVGNSPTNRTDPSGLGDKWTRNFWGSFTEAEWTEDLKGAKAFYHVNHTKPRLFESIYAARGIDIHEAQYLRGVHPTVNAEIEKLQKAWVQNEMDQFKNGWKYNKAKDMEAFLKEVKNDNAFFSRLEAHAETVDNAYHSYYLFPGSKGRIPGWPEVMTNLHNKFVLKRLERLASVAEFQATFASRAGQVLPKALGALAIFCFAQPVFAAFGHTPEQQAAFDQFNNRYQNLVRGKVLNGANPDQQQLGLLVGEWMTYMKSLGMRDEALAAMQYKLEFWLADK
jgi:RHS repeat-associated protein